MQSLPSDVEEYKQTKSFNVETAPAGFLKDHSTKANVWGLLTIETGTLTYVVTDPAEAATYELQAGDQGVIVPQQIHHIDDLSEDVRFHVKFFR